MAYPHSGWEVDEKITEYKAGASMWLAQLSILEILIQPSQTPESTVETSCECNRDISSPFKWMTHLLVLCITYCNCIFTHPSVMEQNYHSFKVMPLTKCSCVCLLVAGLCCWFHTGSMQWVFRAFWLNITTRCGWKIQYECKKWTKRVMFLNGQQDKQLKMSLKLHRDQRETTGLGNKIRHKVICICTRFPWSLRFPKNYHNHRSIYFQSQRSPPLCHWNHVSIGFSWSQTQEQVISLISSSPLTEGVLISEMKRSSVCYKCAALNSTQFVLPPRYLYLTFDLFT